MTRTFAAFVLCASAATTLPAQTFTTLFSFDSASGTNSEAGLIQATDGSLYGTTYGEANGNVGSVFKITPGGVLTPLCLFNMGQCPAFGSSPVAGLVETPNGDFYGTTENGGSVEGARGTIFKMTAGGALTTFYSFCTAPVIGCPDGEDPYGLVQAPNGDLYGTTGQGGIEACPFYDGCGTVFKFTPNGALTTLHTFCAQTGCPDGANPYAGLVRAADGGLYGTTFQGGSNDRGTVFKVTPDGVFTTIYSFCSGQCEDGAYPRAALIQAASGDLYGTTSMGGAKGHGTIFKITPGGVLTPMHSFCVQGGCADGADPYAGLVQASDGNFYGTTSHGGRANSGTIFKMTPGGKVTALYSFCPQTGCADGQYPWAGLVQATNGSFYGTTYFGGANNGGVVFSISAGLGPFVEPQPTSGKVGASVKILGTGLTGATSVTFNGVAAAFTVDSPSEIKTAVPAGATTGKVQVVTPGGTLVSNIAFRVP